MAHIPKYKKLKLQLLDEFESGKYAAGERIPTREELVTQFQVTRTTVNHALRELVESGVLTTGRRGGTVYTGKRPPLKVLVLGRAMENHWFGYQEPARMDIITPLLYHAGEFQLEFAELQETEIAETGFHHQDCIVAIMPDGATIKKLRPFRDKVLIVNRCTAGFHFISTPHRETVADMVIRNIRSAGTPAKAIWLDPENAADPVLEARKEGFRDGCSTCGVRPVMLPVKPDVDFIRTKLDPLLKNPGTPLVIASPMRSLTGVVLEWAGRHDLALQQDLFYSDFDNPYSLSNPEKAVLSAMQDYARIGRELYEVLHTWGKTAEPVRIKVPARPVP